MNTELAKRLVEKGLINTSTEVTAKYKTSSLDGANNIFGYQNFMVVQVLPLGESYMISLVSTVDGHKRTLPIESIVAIDGMAPARFANVYNIKADGTDIKLGKRRGRKPKVRA